MAVAFLLGELFAAEYAVIAVWGLLVLFIPAFAGMILWNIGKKELLLMVAAFVTGLLLIKCVEKPKEAFGYVTEPFTVMAEGEILSIKNNSYYYSIVLKNTNIFYKGKKYFTDGILLQLSCISELRLGDVIAVSGELSSFSVPRNEGEFNLYNYYKSQGIYYSVSTDGDAMVTRNYVKRLPLSDWLYTIRERLITEFLEHCFSLKDAGTMSAIVLGEKSYLEDGLQENFRMSGISHILVVSGLHISLIGMGLFSLLKKLAGYLPACIISGMFVIMYVWLTGFGTSGQRALLMFVVAMFGNFVGKSYDLNSGIGFSLICMLIKTPYIFLNSGFMLSYLSVLAIGIIVPMVEDVMKWACNARLSGIVSGIAIFWVTFPVVLWNYYEYSLFSMILNLLVIPCMSLLVVLGLIGLLGESFFGAGEILLKGPVHIILLYFEKLSAFFNKFTGGRILFGKPSLAQILFIYTMLLIVVCVYFIIKQMIKRHVLFFRVPEGKGIKQIAAFLLVIGISIIEIFILKQRRDAELSITMLDVGQGECVFIETQAGKRILIDSGSTDVRNLYEKRIAPFLKSRAVKKLDYIIVSHADSDHCSSIKEILSTDSGINVVNLVLPDVNGEDKNIAELVALGRSKGCSIVFLSRGDIISIGGIKLYCLNPDSKEHYTEAERNDSSIVLHLVYCNFDMLFTGDISENTEKELLPYLKRCEVLKVAHHGSKYSGSYALLENIMPRIALVSCGEDNNYGHPHIETLERLNAVGSKVFITKNNGGITITADKDKIEVKTFICN